MPRAAVFLDRDGVITALVPDPRTGTRESPYRPDAVRLEPGAVEGLRTFVAARFVLCVVSNQPSAAKEQTTVAALDAVEERTKELLRCEGILLDAWRRCLHHPDAVVPELAGPCSCRKPKPGLIVEAARELDLDLTASWMIGDAETDVLAGRAAGCHTVLVHNPASPHRRGGTVRPDYVVSDLAAAARFIASGVGVC